MVDPTLPLPGLSSIEGKEVIARFDGGWLSSDGGLLVLREIEQRLKVAERLAASAAADSRSAFGRPSRGRKRFNQSVLLSPAGHEAADSLDVFDAQSLNDRP